MKRAPPSPTAAKTVRFRARGPSGAKTLQLEEDQTVEQLLALIKQEMGVTNFTVKSGYPPALLDLSAEEVSLKELNLNGATITVDPVETPAGQPEPSGRTEEKASEEKPKFKPKRVEVDETVVEWPQVGGYLVLRVMPDDNSCMFTAFGGVFGIKDPAKSLREQVAQHILRNPDKYDKVTLENLDPEVYADRIRDPQRWGGQIELACLSEIFDIGICSVDVKYGRVDQYGSEKETRCILVYSGIHYDRIAQTFDLGLPVDMDITQFPSDDDSVLEKAKELTNKLKSASYYTDTTAMAIRCEMPGCENWLGAGERDAVKHQIETGHTAFSELNIE